MKVLEEYDRAEPGLKDLFADPGWGGEAPLWFYILKEAEIVGKGREMGPVGGRIIAEVLVGLLQKDPNSYLYLQPTWKPTTPIAPASGQFTMADLLKFAAGLVLTNGGDEPLTTIAMTYVRTDVNEVMT